MARIVAQLLSREALGLSVGDSLKCLQKTVGMFELWPEISGQRKPYAVGAQRRFSETSTTEKLCEKVCTRVRSSFTWLRCLSCGGTAKNLHESISMGPAQLLTLQWELCR